MRSLPALILALLCLALVPAAASAARDQFVTFEAPRELLADGQREQALDEIRAFGVDRVRALVYWRDVAPEPESARRPSFDAADPAAYPEGAWRRIDALFDAASARGISVQLTPTGPVPVWATRDKRDQVSYPRASDFRDFVTALGRRYGDRVSVWSVWNEPNHPGFLGPQYRKGRAVSPGLYRGLYFAALAGLRESGNGADEVLFGETAPRGTSRVVAPLAFLRGALCLSRSYERSSRCSLTPMSGYAHHAYTTRTGPTYRPGNRDDVTIGVLSRLQRALDRAARAKAAPKGVGIYLTEFGIQSAPDPYLGVSLARQAEYLAHAEWIAYRNSRVRSFSQYLLHDDPPRAGVSRAQRYSGFESGLRRSDGRAKPSYDGFRLPLAADRRGDSDVLWGRVRPHPGATQVEILVEHGREWRPLRAVATDATGVFETRVAHRKSRYRVRWTAPSGTVFEGPPIRAY